VDLESVHFHEVGAVDAMVDIVGSCLALVQLGVERVSVGALPLGRGTVKCAHGLYPCPAPATAELLKGHTVEETEEEGELVTPTGAALLTTWHDPSPPAGPARMVKAGYGFGRRTLKSRPNLLRVLLFESSASPEDCSYRCLVLACHLDDATGEQIGVLLTRLMDAGALDAVAAPIYMKKQRPGIHLTVLCRPEDRARMVDLLFRESGTLGVREELSRRTVLPRRGETVSTPYGPVRIKVGLWGGREVTLAPEMDDCVARSEEHGVSARAVYEAAAAAAHGRRFQAGKGSHPSCPDA
jgi:hypothetical protein